MPHAQCLRCRECGKQYPIEPLNVCEFCFGPLEVDYDYDAIRNSVSRASIKDGPHTIWRYDALLPVGREKAVDIGAGFTPLLRADRLARELGLNNLWLKNDAVNPSYSFKDRVVSVAATKALEFGIDTIACPSTGNLAGAVAAHGAKAGMRTLVFVPADLERGKIIGAAVYGPTVIAVKGNYDDVNRLCSELADSHRWAFVNINMRPYYAEGSKTLGYEVAEQLGWRAPDHAIVPMASGAMITKIYQGLQEFARIGLIDGVGTRMYGAQADGCSPIVKAFDSGHTHPRPEVPRTIAKSLAIGNPADGFYALKAMRDSGGGALADEEHEVAAGLRLLAQTEGIFTETAGGVVVSALRRLARSGAFRPDESVVAYITGNGFKTIEVIEASVKPIVIEPNVESFEDLVLAAGRR
ncbi:MAG: threonine synthase [Chloroflexi bacterium]|nr:threonine synthase [Chloroflexota bacterium]